MRNFTIKCDNAEDFVKIQKYLFSKGYEWRDSGKNIIPEPKFPLYIKTGVPYTKIVRQRTEPRGIKNIDLTKLIRKEKIEKINERRR